MTCNIAEKNISNYQNTIILFQYGQIIEWQYIPEEEGNTGKLKRYYFGQSRWFISVLYNEAFKKLFLILCKKAR